MSGMPMVSNVPSTPQPGSAPTPCWYRGDPLNNAHPTRIVALAAKSKLSGMYPGIEYVDAGGLMSYGVSSTALYRRAATYVDKILRGTKPADLPVEQPKKFEFII